jgi:two-component system NtrC family response regulator
MERMTILIVEDEDNQRMLLRGLLEKEGYRIVDAKDAAGAIELVKEHAVDCLLLDYRLPDLDGLEVLRRVKAQNPELEVIMITAYGTVEKAVEALKSGASDYLQKPVDFDDLLIKLKRIEEKRQLIREIDVLKQVVKERFTKEGFIYASEAMERVMSIVVRVAGTDSTCLITGESGVGKELVANLVHEMSNRREGPLIRVNCAAIPDNLLESELFGYEKGAFTGALQRKPGKFELADKGTIFLDEIGDLSFPLQAKLLRVIEQKEIERLGGLYPFKVDVRIIAATNKDLEQEVKKGSFREDLYFRLNVVTIEIPPLRHRKEEIPLFLDFFLKKFCGRYGKQIKGFTREARDWLMKYDYPGNVRELENIVERAVVLTRGEYISIDDLPAGRGRETGSSLTMKQTVEEIERRMIKEALAQAGGVQKRAAEILGITERILRYKVKKYGLLPRQQEE